MYEFLLVYQCRFSRGSAESDFSGKLRVVTEGGRGGRAVRKVVSSKTAFWDKVELYRKQRNLTYRAIARTMGKPETTVSSMRQFGTEPRISEGIRLADALGVDIRDLAE